MQIADLEFTGRPPLQTNSSKTNQRIDECIVPSSSTIPLLSHWGSPVLVVSEGVPGAAPGHGEVVHVVEHVPGHRAVLESEGRQYIQ